LCLVSYQRELHDPKREAEWSSVVGLRAECDLDHRKLQFGKGQHALIE
jgi:hypothetical protein